MRGRLALPALFSVTLLVSAGLLFSVQPLFTRLALPLLGGTPAVWNTVVVFFQTAVLLGYLYAHAGARWLSPRPQALLLLVLLLAALTTLPVVVAEGWVPPADAFPIPWLVALLAVSVGAPALLVSASAPLLQHWFSRTGHPAAGDPYFLYAASNLGSIGALVAYPLLIEPFLRLATQGRAWTGGYVLLLVLVGACVLLLPRGGGAAAEEPEPAPAPTWRERLAWLLLSFAPASLLLGVTSFASTDLAAVPLLWVVPLATYLLTFVFVFARRPLLRHAAMVRLQPYVLLPVVLILFWGLKAAVWFLFPLHLLAFFFTAMVCHGELVRRRPPAGRLTEFYLWLSLGGLLGGAFNGLLAPVVFDAVVEYPAAIALACALRPAPAEAGSRRDRWLDVLLPAAVLVVLACGVTALGGDPEDVGPVALVVVSCVVAVVVYALVPRPLRFGLGVGAVLLASGLAVVDDAELVVRERSFFGVHRVKRSEEGTHHLLLHGTTVHGAEDRRFGGRCVPLTYFHDRGPLGQVFAARFSGPGRRRVAGVGLGTGSAASYGRPGERWVFYEIDPLVERFARDPELFTFLSACGPEVDVVLGDARLRLSEASDGSYDLLILDAFSSSAIPVHLLTREALAVYFDKLAPGGVLAFHVSNGYLDLTPVLGNLASALGLVGRCQHHVPEAEDWAELRFPSSWVVLARREADLGALVDDERWSPLPVRPEVGEWSDDFSNVLSVFKVRLR